MVIVSNLSKSFGTELLFDDVTFNINHREKIGLVGRNGTGKSTLFKIILKQEHPDSGNISVSKNYRIGYLEQHLKFTKQTVVDETCIGLREEFKDDKWKAEKILSGLGFSTEDMEKNPLIFSGGMQIRINLAKVLVSEPNLLLLDEPGNYLDIVSIRWLTKFLSEWKNELMLITHDRNFMDSVITHTLGLHRQKIRKIEGNTEKHYNQIIKDEEIYEKTRINDEKKRKEVEEYINRFRAKASLATRVQSKIKMLAKSERRDKLTNIQDLDFEFNYQKFESKLLCEISDLSFSYDEKNPLIKNFNLVIAKDDRIAVIGKNGKGKTTLLKLLSGKLNQHNGSIKKHPLLKTGYFEQTNIELLDDKKTVEEEIDNSITNRDVYKARNIAGLMMFEGDNALKKVGVLSGGEKSRVLLGKLLCTPSNLLLLDEPTNHFDMQSCDSILEALDSYQGAVVIVTHNEMFLHSIPNKLVVFDKGKVFIFDGSYEEFLEKIGWDDESAVFNNNQTEKESVNKKDLRKLRAEITIEKSKKLKPFENKMKTLEKHIMENEEKLQILHIDFEKATFENNGENIRNLSIKISETEELINKYYLELDDATTFYEKEAAVFEERLNEIG